MEAEADWKALQTTRILAAARGLFVGFGTTSLGDPIPRPGPTSSSTATRRSPSALRWPTPGRSSGASRTSGGEPERLLGHVGDLSPISSDDVAPGEGAFGRGRCPAGSRARSRRRGSRRPRAPALESRPARLDVAAAGAPAGASGRRRRTGACCSRGRAPTRPMRRCLRARRRKPGVRERSRRDRAGRTSQPAVSSRPNASTAFGPSHIEPSIRNVVWMPRNGNAGPGTG